MTAETGKHDLLQYDGPLSEVDPEVADLVRKEKQRQVSAGGGRGSAPVLPQQQKCSDSTVPSSQVRGLELIASENFTSKAVRGCLRVCARVCVLLWCLVVCFKSTNTRCSCPSCR